MESILCAVPIQYVSNLTPKPAKPPIAAISVHTKLIHDSQNAVMMTRADPLCKAKYVSDLMIKIEDMNDQLSLPSCACGSCHHLPGKAMVIEKLIAQDLVGLIGREVK